jgi:hypothetical protein
MADAHDPIPADGIYLLDAFKSVFRKQTPGWQKIEQQADDAAIALACCSDLLKKKELQSVLDRAQIPLDDAYFKANEMLRNLIIDGKLTAYIRDPFADMVLRLPSSGWGHVLSKPGIASNFVGPNDTEAPGPDTVIGGARRPVFFKITDLQDILSAEIEANSERKRPGRPSLLPIVEAELDRLISEPSRNLYVSKKAAANSLITWFKKTNPGVKPPELKTLTNELSDKLEKITKPKTK